MRRRRERILDRDVDSHAEDVIVTKLRWSYGGGRRKDLHDAQNVIAVQGDRIDWEYVTRWCDRHGTRELLEQVRQRLRANGESVRHGVAWPTLQSRTETPAP